jgi:hypothetical protein
MNEAKQMHDDLLNALLLVIPRTTYQDSRRLSMLAWAIIPNPGNRPISAILTKRVG